VYPGALETVFLLQVPLNAHGQVRVGKSVMDFSRGMACIVSPTDDLEMRFSKTCDHFIFTIEKTRLEHFLEQQLQRRLDKPLEFAPRIELAERQCREFIDLVMHMTHRLQHPSASLQHAMLLPQVESLLVGAMLISLDHNYRAELTAEQASPRPYYIR